MHTTNPFLAISPLDGRYRKTARKLVPWLSETGLNQARIRVEIAWIVFVLKHSLIPGLLPLTQKQTDYLMSLDLLTDATARQQLARLEATTKHDVKAIEYLIREHLLKSDMSHLVELVHFLCTSEDINNLAQALTVRHAVTDVWLPAATRLRNQLRNMAIQHANIPMLARTHGQPATPTTLGKELNVFVWRMTRQLKRIANIEYHGKFNGATGTFSAHTTISPNTDWLKISQTFVESLGLVWNPVTTQIESHDWQIELYAAITHFNRIAQNLATDCWHYISLDYFEQAAEGTTGSSTMPHKVNPIRFENAEANFEMSDGIFEVLSRSLSITRLQRDLSDSSLQRNVGVGLGHSLLAIENLTQGLHQLSVKRDVLCSDLVRFPQVLSEAIQQALRFATLTKYEGTSPHPSPHKDPDSGMEEPYRLLKDMTRGQQVTLKQLRELVDCANLPPDLAARLSVLTPATYVGLAAEIAEL